MSRENRLTCGDFGGKDAQGEPCGVSSVDGPCSEHVEQVRKASEGILNVGFEFMTPPFKRKRDKVCIVGFTGHRDVALTLDRDEWEVWGLNELYRYMPVASFDRWFEIHGREYLEQDDDGKQHMKDLATMSIPIYMQKVHEDIPASVKFPVDEMVEELGEDYFTNCPAYMTGLAIAMGYSEILVCGVDMAQDTEYSVQRPCCEYWLGVARGRGIKAWVPELSDLLKCAGRYGYDDAGSWMSRKLTDRLKWLHSQDNDRLKALRALEHEYVTKREGLQQSLYATKGAITELGLLPKTKARLARIEKLTELVGEIERNTESLRAEYENKNGALTTERNQLVGGIQNTNYILRSLLPKADSVGGGNIPTREQRAADPMTGIVADAPSDDSQVPARVPAGAMA